MTDRLKADIALVSLTVLWGLSFTVVKTALQYSGTFTFLFLRFILATGIVALFLRKSDRSLLKEIARPGLILGSAMFLGFALQTLGLNLTTASRSGFLTGTFVVFTPFIAIPLIQSPVKARHLIAVAIVMIGIFLLTRPDLSDINLGDELTVLCAIVWALHTVLIGKYSSKERSKILAFYQLTLLSVMCLPLSFMLEGMRGIADVRVWGLAGIVAVTATALAFYLQARFQPKTSPQSAAVIYSLEPVFAALFANLLSGESPPNLIGAGLIIIGMVVAEYKGDWGSGTGDW
jgi:drug/metabolite transporter (DMT)-like permease